MTRNSPPPVSAPPTTPAQRKRLQRERDRADGYTEVQVRVHKSHAELVRLFALSLPRVSTSQPGQMSMDL